MKNILFALTASQSVASISAAALGSRANSDLICAQKGWDAGHEGFVSITDGYTNLYTQCLKKCKEQQGCVSFGIAISDCELYDVPLKNNFIADSSSPFSFYDLACESVVTKCGVNGWSKKDSYYYSDHLEDENQCFKNWDNAPSCQSWSYGNGICALYEWTVLDNVDLDTSSPYKFYDQACLNPTLTTTTTSTKSLKTTAKATTITSAKTSAKTTTTTTTTTTKKALPATSSPTTKAVSTTTTTSVNRTTTTTAKPLSTTTAKALPTSAVTTKATSTASR